MEIPKPANDNIGLDDSLRLDEALRFAFPLGGMTVSGLRREAARGRLVIERIANKDFTTLRAIQEMRKLCRVEAGDHGSGGEKTGARTAKLLPKEHGLSLMVSNSTPRAALLAKIERHRNT
jgi:hypothetical protein